MPPEIERTRKSKNVRRQKTPTQTTQFQENGWEIGLLLRGSKKIEEIVLDFESFERENHQEDGERLHEYEQVLVCGRLNKEGEINPSLRLYFTIYALVSLFYYCCAIITNHIRCARIFRNIDFEIITLKFRTSSRFCAPILEHQIRASARNQFSNSFSLAFSFPPLFSPTTVFFRFSCGAPSACLRFLTNYTLLFSGRTFVFLAFCQKIRIESDPKLSRLAYILDDSINPLTTVCIIFDRHKLFSSYRNSNFRLDLL